MLSVCVWGVATGGRAKARQRRKHDGVICGAPRRARTLLPGRRLVQAGQHPVLLCLLSRFQALEAGGKQVRRRARPGVVVRGAAHALLRQRRAGRFHGDVEGPAPGLQQRRQQFLTST